MIDPTVTKPEELSFHFSAYAARLADALEGGTWPREENHAALRNIAQGMEYARLSILAATEPERRSQPLAVSEASAIAAELEALWRRLSKVANSIGEGR